MGKVGERVFPLSQKGFLLMALLLYGHGCPSHSSHLLPPLLQRKDVPGMALRGRRGNWLGYNSPGNDNTISTLISLNTFFIKVYKRATSPEFTHNGVNTEVPYVPFPSKLLHKGNDFPGF